MSKTILYIVAFVSVFLVGGLTFLQIFRSKPVVNNVTLEIPATKITMKIDSLDNKVVQLQKDFRKLYSSIWQFVTAEGESVTIDSNTLYKDVPVVKTSADTNFTVLLNDIPQIIDFHWWAIHKGKLFEVGFEPSPMKYTLELPQEKDPFARFYGSVGGSIDQDKLLTGEFESGFVFKRSMMLFGRVEGDQRMVESDHRLDVRVRAGAKLGFNL